MKVNILQEIINRYGLKTTFDGVSNIRIEYENKIWKLNLEKYKCEKNPKKIEEIIYTVF